MYKEELSTNCNNCLYQKTDIEKGSLCKLTGVKPVFRNRCYEFEPDEYVRKEYSCRKEKLRPRETKKRLSNKIRGFLRFDRVN